MQSLTYAESGNIMFRPEYKGVLDPIERSERDAALAAIPKEDRQRPSGYPSVPMWYPPVYYLLTSLVYRATAPFQYLDVIFSLRVFSVFLSLISLVFQYLTFRLIFPDRPRQILAVAVITLMPMYSFMQMAINPEVAITALFSAFIYLAVRSLRQGHGIGASLVMGAIVGVGLLTKQSMAPAVPAYLVLVGLLLAYRRVNVRQALQYAVLFGVVVLVIAGWWYYLNPSTTSPSYHQGDVPPLSLGGFLDYLSVYYMNYDWVYDTFWGYFGWLDTPVSPRIFELLQAVFFFSLVGLTLELAKQTWRRRVDPVLPFMIVTAALELSFFIGLEYVRVNTGETAFIQGRYFFPVITLIVALQVVGLSAFLPSPVQRRGLMAVIIPALAMFHVISLAQFVIPRYYF